MGLAQICCGHVGDSPVLHALLMLSQLVTLIGYVVVTVGVGMLQDRANNLPLWNGMTAEQRASTEPVYNDVFQSANVIPYPSDSKYQFQHQWFIVQFELMVFLLTAPGVLFPRIIERVRPAALTFLGSALVIVLDNINSVLFLSRSELAKTVFEETRINWTLAGLIFVAVGNFMTIFAYGLFKYERFEYFEPPTHANEMHDNELASKGDNDKTKVAV